MDDQNLDEDSQRPFSRSSASTLRLFISTRRLSPVDASKCRGIVDKMKPVFGDAHWQKTSSPAIQAFTVPHIAHYSSAAQGIFSKSKFCMDVGCDHHMLSTCGNSSFITLGLCNIRPITTTYADPSSLQTCITVNPLHQLSTYRLYRYVYTAQHGPISMILTKEGFRAPPPPRKQIQPC